MCVGVAYILCWNEVSMFLCNVLVQLVEFIDICLYIYTCFYLVVIVLCVLHVYSSDLLVTRLLNIFMHGKNCFI